MARWLGIDPVAVRIAFVVLAVSGGVGLAVYAVLWVAMPDDRGRRVALPHGAASERSQRMLAFVLLTLGGLLLLREVGLWVGDKIVWPAVLAAVGLALVWPRSGESGESAGSADRKSAGPGREPSGEAAAGGAIFGGSRPLLRIGLGVAAVGAGVATFALANADLHALGDALLAVFLAVVGLGFIFGPWGWRVGRELVEERRRRIRSEERAELAARVHDSVLQTLTLIQQHAGDATETVRLARRQERELRAWLFGGDEPRTGTLKAAVAAAAAEVEDLFGIAVEVVTVGDCPLDASTAALTDAAKEALVNAAKFAGVAAVDLYVEVEPERVTAFVRDRGRGFDPAAVPTDRRGLAESVRGRMERHGGRAVVRSAPGEGTEVELGIPRSTR